MKKTTTKKPVSPTARPPATVFIKSRAKVTYSDKMCGILQVNGEIFISTVPDCCADSESINSALDDLIARLQ